MLRRNSEKAWNHVSHLKPAGSEHWHTLPSQDYLQGDDSSYHLPLVCQVNYNYCYTFSMYCQTVYDLKWRRFGGREERREEGFCVLFSCLFFAMGMGEHCSYPLPSGGSVSKEPHLQVDRTRWEQCIMGQSCGNWLTHNSWSWASLTLGCV